MQGKGLAEEIKQAVRQATQELGAHGVSVGLAVLQVGENPASSQYRNAIKRACAKVGIQPYEHVFPPQVSLNELLNAIRALNADERVHGVLVLFPLPQRLDARRVVNAIAPEKDVDGLGAISIGRLAAEESTYQLFGTSQGRAARSFLPCTPFGVIRLLEHYRVPIRGRHVVVVGKSLAVGRPLSLMFLAREATVSVCHRETQNLGAITRQADILCVATGVSHLIRAPMVKPGAVVVDIGISILPDGTVTGDVHYQEVQEVASMLTPVPGGVGPVTIAMLLENTVRSAQSRELLKGV
jgi:methylenetetrahydrofolate dehydrogenase (NADP+)/methenyltetrahydrofolate cyclohydrolase